MLRSCHCRVPLKTFLLLRSCVFEHSLGVKTFSEVLFQPASSHWVVDHVLLYELLVDEPLHLHPRVLVGDLPRWMSMWNLHIRTLTSNALDDIGLVIDECAGRWEHFFERQYPAEMFVALFRERVCSSEFSSFLWSLHAADQAGNTNAASHAALTGVADKPAAAAAPKTPRRCHRSSTVIPVSLLYQCFSQPTCFLLQFAMGCKTMTRIRGSLSGEQTTGFGTKQ